MNAKSLFVPASLTFTRNRRQNLHGCAICMFAQTILDVLRTQAQHCGSGSLYGWFSSCHHSYFLFFGGACAQFLCYIRIAAYVNNTNLNIFFHVLLDENALPNAAQAVGKCLDTDTADNAIPAPSISTLLSLQSSASPSIRSGASTRSARSGASIRYGEDQEQIAEEKVR